MRRHIHCLLILPLFVIAATFPTAARIVETDGFWLHSWLTYDAHQKIWDAWHLQRALAGQTSLFYTEALFHPVGISLAFHASSLPHAALLLALQQVMATDDAYNLLYLLMLCFNGFCAYALIVHLLGDRWVALFGAVAVACNVWFTDVTTSPDLLMTGMIPLTLLPLRRAVMEQPWRWAALAGVCAGVTAFVGLYIFVFVLISLGVYALYLAMTPRDAPPLPNKAGRRWRERGFWLRLALAAAVCAPIALTRLHPMLADLSNYRFATDSYLSNRKSQDLMRSFVLPDNPVTGDFLSSLLNVAPDLNHGAGYLGYVSLFLLIIALVKTRTRWRLAPWLALFLFFAALKSGDYLSFNTVGYAGIALPLHSLRDWLPAVFGNIGSPSYYLTGMIPPLAVLSCYGLHALLRSRPETIRALAALLAMLVFAVEHYTHSDVTAQDQSKRAYLDWLETEASSPTKLINLPHDRVSATWYLYAQSLSDYPTAMGFANRKETRAVQRIDRNLLLRHWAQHKPVACLPARKAEAFSAALDNLLAEGFTHVVLHRWRSRHAALLPNFYTVPAAYDDEFASVYRLADMRGNCQPPVTLPSALGHFLQAPRSLPVDISALVSYHPSDNIGSEDFAWLAWLLEQWDSLHHLHQRDDEWQVQSAGGSYARDDEAQRNRLLLYLAYDAEDGAPQLPPSLDFRSDYRLCQRDARDDSAVLELYISRRFDCALLDAQTPLRVVYDNGLRLENLLYSVDGDQLDWQFWWSDRPYETHSVSVQVFSAAGDKVLAQDFVIGHRALAAHSVDLSSLPPGDYRLKLIVYNYDSKASVAGTASSSGGRFERELDLASFQRL